MHNDPVSSHPPDGEFGSDNRPELPEVSLEDLPAPLQRAAMQAGWSRLMPVQARAIPYLRAGRDLMVQSRTGSGKTGAFMLPILDRVDPRRNACQALILVPTRELARQVGEQSELLAGSGGVRTVIVYGGVGYGPQLEGFKKGAHIVVGTPGRVLDHLIKRTLTVDQLRILIFDEADRLLSMGFYPDMREIRSHLPSRPVHSCMFSATFPYDVIRLSREFLSEPKFLSLSKDHVHVTDTEHVYYVTPPMDKDRALVRIVEMENPPSAIIFCNTRARVEYVTTVLQRFGYDADQLSSDLPQAARERVLLRLREARLRFLVATDVAARGLDISELSHVIQYEPPEDPDSYIHRAGRTGRAGASGEAITLVTPLEETELARISRRFQIEMEQRALPTDEDVQAIVSQRLTALLEAERRNRDLLKVERMQRFIPLARSLAQNDEEVDLLAMLLDDSYQKTLHPQPLPEPLPASRPRDRQALAPGSSQSHRKRSGRRSADRNARSGRR